MCIDNTCFWFLGCCRARFDGFSDEEFKSKHEDVSSCALYLATDEISRFHQTFDLCEGIGLFFIVNVLNLCAYICYGYAHTMSKVKLSIHHYTPLEISKISEVL